jgi:hypothetical protein
MFKVSPASLQTFIDTPNYLAQSECLAADRHGRGGVDLTDTNAICYPQFQLRYHG